MNALLAAIMVLAQLAPVVETDGEWVENPFDIGPPSLPASVLDSCGGLPRSGTKAAFAAFGRCLEMYRIPLVTCELPDWYHKCGSIDKGVYFEHRERFANGPPWDTVQRDFGGKTHEIRYSTKFTTSEDDLCGDPHLKLISETLVDLDFLRQEMPSTLSSTVPASSCNDRYEVRALGFRVQGGGVHVSADFKYENWACCISCVPCPTWQEPLRMCDATNRNFEKTVGIAASLVPALVDGRLQITLTPSLDERGGLPAELEFLKRVLDVVGQGGQVSKRYQEEMGNIRDLVTSSQKEVVNEALLNGPLRRAGVKLQTSAFEEIGGRITLRVLGSVEVPQGSECDAHDQLSDWAIGK